MLDPGTWSACFGMCWAELLLYDAATSKRLVRPGGQVLRKVAGAAGISEARNQVAATFLDSTDAEWLFMVDTDMGFAPDTVDRLLASADRYARPVMGALCFALREVEPGPYYSARYGVIPTVYDYVETGDEVGFSPVPDYPRDAVTEVAGTGAACLLVHRRALHAVREKYGPAWFDPATHPTGLRGGRRTFSEDLSFCVRLAGAGVPLHVDTSVKTVHHKGGLYLDEDVFTNQQAAAAAADAPAA
jgi:hypothetical protein